MSLLFPKAKKPCGSSVVTAGAYVRAIARGLTLPPKAVISPFAGLAKAFGGNKKYVGNVPLTVGEKCCFATLPGCGGPAVAMTVEILAALGVNEMIFLGLAGSLQEEVEVGDIVVCDSSLCADGTCACYTTKEIVRPSRTLFTRFTDTLTAKKENFHVGCNWSTDAIYRETKAQIKHYQKQHALTVEMETSAFYAASAKLNVRAVSALVISDTLHRLTWQPQFNNPVLWKTLQHLSDSARATLNAK